MDLCIAVPCCILLAPVFALVAAAVKLDSDGPVLFVQERRGRNFKLFRFVKFRSLRHAAPDPHDRYEMVAADPRITRLGSFLRRSSIDELPQLFQVITGSMSLVGPRPLVEWESQECLNGYSERFCVKPGITGLSQVTVRNSVNLAGRCEKDIEYVQGWSLGLDIRILLSTPLALLRGSGVYPVATEHPVATAEKRHG
jgi:putative colanic acid biosynthesis UDP-glucose lipid carrier transferase